MAGKEDGQEPEIEVIVEDENPADAIVAEDDKKKTEDANAEEGGEEKGKPQKKTKSRRGNTESTRITKLLWEKQEALDREASARAELEAVRASNAQYEGIAAQSLEDGFSTKRDLLTQQLRDAHTEGDAAKIAKTTSELSKVEAQAAQMERYKLEKSAKPAQQPQKPVATAQQQSDGMSFDDLYDNGNTEMRNWLDSNRDWFHQDSENYNQEMVEDITTKANRLEQEWQRSGRGSEIGTRAYFKAMNRYINENWGNEDEPVTKNPTPGQKGYAAPVNGRQSPNGANPKRETVTIAGWEKNIAINTPLIHESGPNKGKSLSDDEKIKVYIGNRKIMQANPTGEITMNLLRKGN